MRTHQKLDVNTSGRPVNTILNQEQFKWEFVKNLAVDEKGKKNKGKGLLALVGFGENTYSCNKVTKT